MMWTSHDSIGFVFLSSLCIQFGFAFEGRFTDLPSNITATEGQNIEMACAFQSGTASVYLEIQWWFIKAPEEPSSQEEEEEEEEEEEMELIPELDPDDEGTKISTVKVQGNDISHKLQISRVGKNDEGLYECRVTNANYGELLEYKAQAFLKVNATVRPRSKPPPKKTSPLHLTADKKPRKSSGASAGQEAMSSDQRVGATSSSHTSSSKTIKHNTGSGTRIATSYGLTILLLTCGVIWDALL